MYSFRAVGEGNRYPKSPSLLGLLGVTPSAVRTDSAESNRAATPMLPRDRSLATPKDVYDRERKEPREGRALTGAVGHGVEVAVEQQRAAQPARGPRRVHALRRHARHH